MYAEGKFIDVRTLAAKIKDTDLGIGDTAVETGFGVRLLIVSLYDVLESLARPWLPERTSNVV